MADGLDRLVGHSHVDELGKPLARLVDHPECPIGGPGERAGGLDDPEEHGGEIETRLDGKDGIEQGLDLIGIANGVIRHRDILPLRTSIVPRNGPSARLTR